MNLSSGIPEKYSQWKSEDKREKYGTPLFESLKSILPPKYPVLVQSNNSEIGVQANHLDRFCRLHDIMLNNSIATKTSETTRKSEISSQQSSEQHRLHDRKHPHESTVTHRSSQYQGEECLVRKSRSLSQSQCHVPTRNSRSEGRGSTNTLLTQLHYKKVILLLLRYKMALLLPLILSLFSLASAECVNLPCNIASCRHNTRWIPSDDVAQPNIAQPFVPVIAGNLFGNASSTWPTSETGLCQSPLNQWLFDRACSSFCRALEKCLCYVCSPDVHPPGSLNIRPGNCTPGFLWRTPSHHPRSHHPPPCDVSWPDHHESAFSNASLLMHCEMLCIQDSSQVSAGNALPLGAVCPLFTLELSFLLRSLMVLVICWYIKHQHPLHDKLGPVSGDAGVRVPIQETFPSDSNRVMKVYRNPPLMSLLRCVHHENLQASESDCKGDDSEGESDNSHGSHGESDDSHGNSGESDDSYGNHSESGNSGNPGQSDGSDGESDDESDSNHSDSDDSDSENDEDDGESDTYEDHGDSDDHHGNRTEGNHGENDDNTVYPASFSPPGSVEHDDGPTPVPEDVLPTSETKKARTAILEAQTQQGEIVAHTGPPLEVDIVLPHSSKQPITVQRPDSVGTQSVEDDVDRYKTRVHAQDSDSDSESSSSDDEVVTTVASKITISGHKGSASISKLEVTKEPSTSALCIFNPPPTMSGIYAPQSCDNGPPAETNAVFLDEQGLAVSGGNIGPAYVNDDLEFLPIVDAPQPIVMVDNKNFVDPFVCCFDHDITQHFTAQCEPCIDDDLKFFPMHS